MRSFPHRHGDATGKPETRDERRGSTKTNISCETSSNFDTFHTLSNRLECHKVPRLPLKTTGQPSWKHSKRTCFPASPHRHGDATGKPATRDKTCGCRKPAFRTRLPTILTFLTHYQTGWNVTKCLACHAKRHDNFLGNLQKGEVLRLPPKTRRIHRNTRDSRRDKWEHQNDHFVRYFRRFSQLAT